MPDPIILGNLPAATAPLVGSEAVPCDQLVGAPLAATALVPGLGYRIVSVGTGTNWQACGVPAGVTAVAGLQFVCSAAGTGTGTAQQVATVRATPDQIAARAAGAISSAISTHLADPTAHAAAIGAEVAEQIAAITHLDASITGAVSAQVRNITADTLPAGTPCRFGSAVGGSDTFNLVVSRGDTPSTLPAAGVLEVALAPGATGHLIRIGPCHGVVTTGMTEGAELWVGQTGGFTTTPPTGLGQPIGSVGKSHASNGSINVDLGTVTSLIARTGSFGDLTDEPVLPDQAEAEEGTATTARLWSSLRVRQGAAAWWQAITGAVGRSLAGAATAADARSTLQLGDSATRNVGTTAGTVAAGDAPAAAAAAAVSGHVTALPHLSTGGSAGQVQFRNAAGAFGGAAGLVADEASGRLTLASFLPGAAPAAPASGFALFADSSGRFGWQRVGGNSLTIDASAFTAARVITFQDKSGTVAYLGDFAAVEGYAPGRWTCGSSTTIGQGTAPGAANVIEMVTFRVKRSLVIDGMAGRVTAASTGASFQLAIYGSTSQGDITGLPLIKTADMSAGSTTVVQATTGLTPETATLEAGKLYWFAVAYGSPTIAINAQSSADLSSFFETSVESLSFWASQASVTFARRTTATYGTWPDMTGVSTTIVSGQRGALPVFRIASLP